MVSQNLLYWGELVILVVYWYLLGITQMNESLYTQVTIWVNAIQIPY